ncbi:hypothetical protein AURDEDRAFT_121866 [Auricularia subglabra TFB-10046 SS5]|nr:hypothetical protein AURDEDRAFT_121866 [Auricularia subglabra TFB-10046 SS5]
MAQNDGGATPKPILTAGETLVSRPTRSQHATPVGDSMTICDEASVESVPVVAGSPQAADGLDSLVGPALQTVAPGDAANAQAQSFERWLADLELALTKFPPSTLHSIGEPVDADRPAAVAGNPHDVDTTGLNGDIGPVQNPTPPSSAPVLAPDDFMPQEEARKAREEEERKAVKKLRRVEEARRAKVRRDEGQRAAAEEAKWRAAQRERKEHEKLERLKNIAKQFVAEAGRRRGVRAQRRVHRADELVERLAPAARTLCPIAPAYSLDLLPTSPTHPTGTRPRQCAPRAQPNISTIFGRGSITWVSHSLKVRQAMINFLPIGLALNDPGRVGAQPAAVMIVNNVLGRVEDGKVNWDGRLSRLGGAARCIGTVRAVMVMLVNEMLRTVGRLTRFSRSYLRQSQTAGICTHMSMAIIRPR